MRRFVSAFTLLGVCVSALGCSSPDPGSAPSDMGGVAEAYQEVARRLGILPDGGPRDMKGPAVLQ